MKNLINSKNISYLLRGLAFALVILTPDISYAPTYCVAMTGSDSNLGTKISPFRNIKQAVSSLSAGDTLCVKVGTYEESLMRRETPIPSGRGITQQQRGIQAPRIKLAIQRSFCKEF